MTIISTFVSLAILVVNIFVIVYLKQLETIGCKCALDFRRTYIYTYLILSILNIFIVGILRYLATSLKSRMIAIALFVWSFIMFFAGILYIIFSVQYIHRLRKEKCECSESVTRNVWEVVMYISISLIILSFLILSYILITTGDIKKMTLPSPAVNSIKKQASKSLKR